RCAVYCPPTIFSSVSLSPLHFLFFFNATSTTEIYTLSLHDALPISRLRRRRQHRQSRCVHHAAAGGGAGSGAHRRARTHRAAARSEEPRLNSSHLVISYAVFCLKKKINKNNVRMVLTLIEYGVVQDY